MAVVLGSEQAHFTFFRSRLETELLSSIRKLSPILLAMICPITIKHHPFLNNFTPEIDTVILQRIYVYRSRTPTPRSLHRSRERSHILRGQDPR